MEFKRIFLLMAFFLVIVSASAIASADTNSQADSQTFSAIGNGIGYSQDILHHAKITKDANIELMQFKIQNQNNPVKYNVTVSKSQLDQLKSAKDHGEFKEIQIETNQSIVVKEPVIENSTRKVCSQDYFDDASFERDLNNLEGKILDSNIKVNVTSHFNPLNGADYKRITVYKTDYIVKSFKNSSNYITASVVVNDMQADGKDWVFFHAHSLGIDGTMAAGHIEI